MPKYDNLPAHFTRDVQEYIDLNNLPYDVESLDPETFFRYYCEWNGIINYSATLLELARELLVEEEPQPTFTVVLTVRCPSPEVAEEVASKYVEQITDDFGGLVTVEDFR